MQATDLVFRVDEIPTDVLDVDCLTTVFDQLRTRSLEMALLCHPDIHSIATSWDRLEMAVRKGATVAAKNEYFGSQKGGHLVAWFHG